MKALYTIVILALSLFLNPNSLLAQDAKKKTETFKVHGNCGMCKSKIENTLKKKEGIVSGKYNIKKQTLTVTFDPSQLTVKQIGQVVADVGYDNEYATAPDEKYNKLHECCQYKRPEH